MATHIFNKHANKLEAFVYLALKKLISELIRVIITDLKDLLTGASVEYRLMLLLLIFEG